MRPARSELHELFVEKFDRRYHPRKPITPEEVREIEVELGVVLPAVYGQFVGRYGCIDTSIDTLLEYEGPYHPQFEGFVRLEEILQVVGMGWITIVPAQLAGVSADVEGNVFDYLVPFGHDGGGNYFCFPKWKETADDLPIYLFDHELSPNIKRAAESFDELLWWYVKNVGSKKGKRG